MTCLYIPGIFAVCWTFTWRRYAVGVAARNLGFWGRHGCWPGYRMVESPIDPDDRWYCEVGHR